MTDVGLGQNSTLTGELRSRKLQDAATDSLPFLGVMKSMGGIRRVAGGRVILQETLSAGNSTVGWVGANGSVSIGQENHADSPQFPWYYLMGSLVVSIAEMMQNSGGRDTQYIELVGTKQKALEASLKNTLHAGVLSSGSASNQLVGVAGLVSTTPSTGTVGGIARSSSDAAWFRNSKFDTGNDWSDGAADSGNITRVLRKALDGANRVSDDGVDMSFEDFANVGLLGQTHWDALAAATESFQVINETGGTKKLGARKIIYADVPMFLSGGLTYSSNSQQTATRSYILDVSEGGVNLVFHKEAEFAMLDKVNSRDQAAFSKLSFTMCTMTIGRAKQQYVIFD